MADDPDLQSLTNRTARDNLQDVLTAALSAVPIVGGPLAVLVAEYIPLSRQERLHNVIAKLAANIEALGDRVNADFIRTDAFAELFETALDDALRASEEEKRAAYAAILANALTDSRPGEEESLLFTDLLRQCRSLHIRILSGLRNAPEPPEDEHYGFSMGTVFTTMKDVFPPFDEQLFRLAWGDLSRWGLVTIDTGSLSTVSSGRSARNLRALLSPLGGNFAAFIATPGR